METAEFIELHVNPYALISFLAYIIIVLLIGIFSAKFSSKGLGEFFLGGRKMNKFVVALSAVVSGRSSWLLIGLTGMAFIRGVSAIWAAAGYIIVEFLMFLYAAPRLREQTEQNDDLTISDYFASRHNDNTNLLRILSAVIIIIFMTAYISAQLVGGGKAFGSSFGFSNSSGVIITAVIILLYTLMGGFLAVSLTDVIQAVFMLFALFILPVIAIIDFGGIQNILTTVNTHNSSILDPFSLSTGAFFGFIGIGLGSPGNPHILVRYMSIKNSKDLRFSAYTGTFWNSLMAISAVFIGVVGKAYFQNASSLPYGDPENLYPYLAQVHLHPILFGVVIASILAAIMSTADSMLLVCASAVIRDLYQKVINPSKVFTQKELVFYSRIIIIVLMAISVVIGFIASDLVFWLVLFAWGGLGAAFGPALILSLYWKGANRYGIAAGFISGVIVTIVWNQIAVLKQMIYELVPAFIISFVLTIGVSLLTKSKQRNSK